MNLKITPPPLPPPTYELQLTERDRELLYQIGNHHTVVAAAMFKNNYCAQGELAGITEGQLSKYIAELFYTFSNYRPR